MLFGLLSVVGGVGLFLVTETFQFEEGAFLAYRRAAAGFAGYGLPAFLYGLVVTMEGNTRTVAVGVVGVLLSALAVFAFFTAYPGQWDLATSPTFVVGSLAVYGVGAMLSSFAAGGAMLARIDEEYQPGEERETGPETETETEAETETETETGFVWGDPPDG